MFPFPKQEFDAVATLKENQQQIETRGSNSQAHEASSDNPTSAFARDYLQRLVQQSAVRVAISGRPSWKTVDEVMRNLPQPKPQDYPSSPPSPTAEQKSPKSEVSSKPSNELDITKTFASAYLNQLAQSTLAGLRAQQMKKEKESNLQRFTTALHEGATKGKAWIRRQSITLEAFAHSATSTQSSHNPSSPPSSSSSSSSPVSSPLQASPHFTALLASPELERIARLLASGEAKHVIVLTGAGISTAAGIPDFRSPGTGLYDNLAKYKLPYPEAVFDLEYLKKSPEPFFTLAKELFPGKYCPTISHCFIRLLAQKGLLVRNYSQNIDDLELLAGVPPNLVQQAHGSFAMASCIQCGTGFISSFVEDRIMGASTTNGLLSRADIPTCTKCNGIVKPNIVFFGEDLPAAFFNTQKEDFKKCDLLIVSGTSLKVFPFASLPRQVGAAVPRLVINNEKLYQFQFGDGRDVMCESSADDGFLALATLIGWGEELRALHREVVEEHGARVKTGKEKKEQKEKVGDKEKAPARKKPAPRAQGEDGSCIIL